MEEEFLSPSSRDSISSESPLLMPPSFTMAGTDREDDASGILSPDIQTAGEDSRPKRISDERARAIVRRIDGHIMPLLFLTYMFNFMDKTILSSASVFGLREDNHLKGDDYAWVSSVFYFGYLLWTYPTSVLVARLSVARYLALNTLFWGVVVALTATCSSFGGLVAVRFFLGVAEATVSPALMFITSTWYTRDEIPVRTGIWFAGNSAGGIASSLFAYGVGHIHGGAGAWRWMFVILGVLTFILGIFLLFLLPDSISSAKFLSEEEDERQWAMDRVVVTGLGRTEKTVWRWEQTRECLVDPKTWLVWSIALLCQIPNGGTQNFANLVLTSFGFTPLQSTLINIPYSLVSIAAIAGSGYLASGLSRSLHCALVALVVTPPVVGSALIASNRGRGVALLGYFLLATGPAALPLLLSLVQANFRGVTKKMTMTALLFVAYCAGNIAGPHLFIAHEAPAYDTAFRAILVCYSLVVGLSGALRAYLQYTNHRRQRREGSAGASGAGEVDRAVQLRPEDYEDVTDWKTFGFRYRL
ncbi:MFS general substrate transporter [Xylariaceae sp. FL0594]|nr:MFS general substrate transporter [Xylariaceae sp. FL0594]